MMSDTPRLLCVIPGPTEVLATQPDDRERWCFKCRHRHLHMWELLGDAEPSWYDPVWVRSCPDCGGDFTEFPRGEL